MKCSGEGRIQRRHVGTLQRSAVGSGALAMVMPKITASMDADPVHFRGSPLTRRNDRRSDPKRVGKRVETGFRDFSEKIRRTFRKVEFQYLFLRSQA